MECELTSPIVCIIISKVTSSTRIASFSRQDNEPVGEHEKRGEGEGKEQMHYIELPDNVTSLDLMQLKGNNHWAVIY